MRGEVAEVRLLAGWLRDLLAGSGLTLLQMSQVIPYGKDLISRKINGETVPEWPFVEAFVAACLPRGDSAGREQALRKARSLWEAAERAAAGAEPPVTAPAGARVAEPRDEGRAAELARALRTAEEHRERARELAAQQQQAISTLMYLLGALTQARNQLTAERDALRARLDAETTARRQADERLRDVQERLAAAEERRRRAEQRLSEANQQLGRTRYLYDKATVQSLQAREDLQELAAPPPSDAGREPPVEPPPVMGAADQDAADTVLDNVESLLAGVDHDLDELEDELARADSDDHPATTPDNPPTSTDNADNPVPAGHLVPADEPMSGQLVSPDHGEAVPAADDPAETVVLSGTVERRRGGAVLDLAPVVIIAAAIIGLLVVFACYSSPDVRLQYAQGTHGSIPEHQGQDLRWTLPGRGRIDTTWTIEPGAPRATGLTGQIDARNGGADDSGCWGRVQVTLYADGDRLYEETLHYTRNNYAYRRLNDVKLPRRPSTIRLTAQRVDQRPCNTHLTWESIGLNASGPGPFGWDFDTARNAT
ncbi:MAG TPA: hypothetical protein VHJ17_14020 [Thermomonospora sp.]|nr:hypothetical protein [Thermomonospora sp.]